MIEQKPLFSSELEYQLLSACMQKPETIDMVGVTIDHFAIQDHKHIFESISNLYRHGVAVDCFTVLEDLATKNLQEQCGGLNYIGPMMGEIASAPGQYAKVLAQKATQRAIAEASVELLDIAHHPDMDSDDRVEAALSAVLSVQKSAKGDSGPSHASEAIKDAVEFAMRTMNLAEGEILGLTTGIKDLDKTLNGLQRGDLVVIAGRPSMGKSSLGMQIAEANAKQKKNTLVFTLEMSKAQLMLRTLSGVSGVSLSSVMKGMSGEESARFSEAGGAIMGWPLWIDERPALTVGKIASASKRKKIRKGLDLIVIDQLTHIKLPGTGPKHQELGDITKRAKALAKELDVPVVLLHQLRRPAEGKVHRPDMTMLKDSGSIEEDADVIILIHRPGYYDQTEQQDYAELIVEKNRMGQRGTVKTGWQGNLTRFTNNYSELIERKQQRSSNWEP